MQASTTSARFTPMQASFIASAIASSLGLLIALGLLLRLPILAGPTGITLAVLGLFVLPGIGWLGLTGFWQTWPPPARLGLAFVAGLVPYSLLAFPLIVLHYPAQAPPQTVLLAGTALQAVQLGLLWWRRKRLIVQAAYTSAEPARHWLPMMIIALVVVALALALTSVVSAYLPLGPQDSWSYANLVQWTVDHPGEAPPLSPGLRFTLNSWLQIKAVLSWATNTPAIELIMQWLPALLLLASISITYGLAFTVSQRHRAAWLAVIFQLLFYLTYVGSNALLGVFATLRLGEDKALAVFIIMPAALLWLIRWLEQRDLLAALWFALTAGAAAFIHPVSLALLFVSGSSYFLLSYLHQPDRRLLTRYVLPAMVLVIPAFIVIGSVFRQQEAGGISTAEPTISYEFAVEALQIALTTTRPANQYVVHPQLLHPLMFAALGIAVAAARFWRRKDARLLLATILIPAGLMFTPYIAPVIGELITLNMLERFLWFWPVGVACALALDALLQRLSVRHVQQAGVIAAAAVVLLAMPGTAASWEYHFWFGTTQNIRPEEIQVRDFLAGLAAETGGVIHAAPPPRLLPVLVGYTPEVVTHTRHRLRGLRITELTATTWISTQNIAQLNNPEAANQAVSYVIVERDTTANWHLYLRPDRFTPVYENAVYSVFHFSPGEPAQIDALLQSLSLVATEAAGDTDFSAPADLLAALQEQQSNPNAPPAILHGLGWLAYQSGDYTAARQHFANLWVQAPAALPLFAADYVDALIQLGDADAAREAILTMLPQAGPAALALVDQLAALAITDGPESPAFDAFYNLAFAEQTAPTTRESVLRHWLETDLFKIASLEQLAALLDLWATYPAETRPDALSIAEHWLSLRYDPEQAQTWLDRVPAPQQDNIYWRLQASLSLLRADFDAAQTALENLRTSSGGPQPAAALFAAHRAGANGDLSMALAGYQAAHEQDPANTAALLSLGQNHEQLAQWDEAASLYSALADSGQPDAYLGSYNLARLYDQLDQPAQAQQAYARGIQQQAAQYPSLPAPPRHALPVVQNPLLLLPVTRIMYWGVYLLGGQTITRNLAGQTEAIFRLCTLAGVPLQRNLFWQMQVIQPEAAWLLGQTRQPIPPPPPDFTALCWPVVVPLAESSDDLAPGSLPEPPIPARLEVLSLDTVILDDPVTAAQTMFALPPAAEITSGSGPVATVGNFTLLDAYWPDPIPGSSLEVTLVWQAETLPTTDYTFFVHLLDSNNQQIAQHDQQPYAGRFPTWTAERPVQIVHSLPLPPDIPPGSYRLLAGIYNARDFTRLPAFSAAGEQLLDDLLVLDVLILEAAE